MRKRRAASRSFVETKQTTDAREIPGTRAEKETSASRRRDVKWRGGVTHKRTAHRRGGKEKRPFNGPRL